jgi:hypothetical protein
VRAGAPSKTPPIKVRAVSVVSNFRIFLILQALSISTAVAGAHMWADVNRLPDGGGGG